MQPLVSGDLVNQRQKYFWPWIMISPPARTARDRPYRIGDQNGAVIVGARRIAPVEAILSSRRPLISLRARFWPLRALAERNIHLIKARAVAHQPELLRALIHEHLVHGTDEQGDHRVRSIVQRQIRKDAERASAKPRQPRLGRQRRA